MKINVKHVEKNHTYYESYVLSAHEMLLCVIPFSSISSQVSFLGVSDARSLLVSILNTSGVVESRDGQKTMM